MKIIKNSKKSIKNNSIEKVAKVKTTEVFRVTKSLKVTEQDLELNTLAVPQAIQNAEKTVKEQKNRRLFNISFFVLNVLILGLVLIYQVNTIGYEPFSAIAGYGSLPYLWYVGVLFIAIMGFETLRTFILVLKSTKKARPFLSYKSASVCRYYECLTPFAAGGQPFEIHYLFKRGLSGGVASGVSMAKAIYNNMALLIVSTLLLIFNGSVFGDNTVVLVLASITLVITLITLIMLFLFSISKVIMPKVLMFFLKLLNKIKLVKNPKESFNKYMHTVLEYQKSIKFYLKDIFTSIISVICSISVIILRALIPFVIYVAFGNAGTLSSMIELITKFVIVELAAACIPLPGGTGVAEVSFSALFAALFKDGTLFWAVLIWRFFTYFIYLVQGFFVIAYDFFYGDKKHQRKLSKTNSQKE